MNLSHLPQKVIDYYLKYRNQNKQIKSTWNGGEFKITSIREKPYYRILFMDHDKKFIYKIFHDNLTESKFKQYNIVNTFNLAVQKDFFKDIALVQDYIKYEGKCIGYIYPICNKVSGLRLRDTSSRLADLKYQPQEFENLYKKLCRNVSRSKIGFTDLFHTNIVEKNKRMYLIDLDSLLDLKKANTKVICQRYDTLPLYYKNFLIKIINNK